MEVMLINPPAPSAIKDVLDVSSPPLGLAYLAAVAREEALMWVSWTASQRV